MKPKIKNNLLVYGIPTLAALLVRIVLAINWWDSPVRWYSNISGLDMKTILQTGEWLYNGGTSFALYKALLTAILFINKGVSCPEAVIIIQLIGGMLIAPLVTWCTFRIWGKKYWALASGLLAALYSPAMMYQVVILKESILLFFALLSLSAVLWVHKHHFSSKALWVCGIFLALACICRMNALPFCGLASLWIISCLFKKLKGNKKAVLYRTAFLALGILTVFIPVSIINACLTDGSAFLPVQMPSIVYISKLGSVVNPQSMNISLGTSQKKPIATTGFIINVARKVPSVFSTYEIPNNINYYFLKYKLFPLQYLIGPFLLIPFAVTALTLLLFNRGVLRKESILFIYIFSYMLAMCYFIPLARYRLVLTPVFCMLAPYPFFALWRAWSNKKLFPALLPVIVFAAVIYMNLPLKAFLRSTDFVSYGKGIEYKTGKSAAALPYFQEAYNMAPYEQMTIVNLSEALLKDRQPDKALKILIPAHEKEPENLAYRYYLGIAYFFTQSPEKAEKMFKKINPGDMGDLKTKYYYFYESSLRMQKKYKAAAELRRKALKDANGQ